MIMLVGINSTGSATALGIMNLNYLIVSSIFYALWSGVTIRSLKNSLFL